MVVLLMGYLSFFSQTRSYTPFAKVVCRGIHPGRLLLEIPINLTLLKLSDDLITQAFTSMRLLSCHYLAFETVLESG